MKNECEALPGVAYPRVRDNRSTLNTKTRYDDDDEFIKYTFGIFRVGLRCRPLAAKTHFLWYLSFNRMAF